MTKDHPIRNLMAFYFVLAFPFAVFSRRLSSPWYDREVSEVQVGERR